MRQVNSAFWAALQRDTVHISELIELTTTFGTFRWTTSNAPMVVSSQTYDPFPGVSKVGAEESTDLGIGTISFSMVNTGNINRTIQANGLDNSEVVISRVLTNSPNLGRLYVFRGKLGDIVYDRQMIGGQVRNLFNGVNQRFPSYSYQDTCVWRFGSIGCGVNANSYTVTGAVDVANSNPLVVTATGGSFVDSPGWLDRGRFTMTFGSNSGQLRTIRTQSGGVMILSHALPFAIESGSTYQVWPGCRKRLAEDCVPKYNNAEHFFGFPWIPKTEQAFSG